MLKKNRTQTLIKVGAKEATTCFDAHTSQDKASYDGDISEVDEEDVEVIPDEVDDAQMEGLKPVGAKTLTNNEGQEVTNKEDSSQTSKPTDISEKMGGPHVKDSLSPWAQTKPPSSSRVCLYCNKSHNSRDSLMNHIQFHYRMVLVCPICSSCELNQWRTVKGHIKKCAAA